MLYIFDIATAERDFKFRLANRTERGMTKELPLKHKSPIHLDFKKTRDEKPQSLLSKTNQNSPILVSYTD